MGKEDEATPVTTPVVEATLAREGLNEYHVPPETELVNVIVEPTQTTIGPDMADG